MIANSPRLVSLILFLLSWEVLARILVSDMLPSPMAVFLNFYKALVSGELPYHLGVTLLRVLASFILAMLIGVAVGMLMGSYRRWDSWLDGLLILGLNIPALVTIILCYIWFGLNEVAAVLAVAVNKIPTVVVAVREGAKAIDQSLMDVARVFRLPKSRTFFKVYLPQLYPYLFGAARNGLALIWKIVLVVELLGRSNGVGFQLGNFFQFFDIESLLAYTVAFVLVILLIEALVFRPAEQYLTRWR